MDELTAAFLAELEGLLEDPETPEEEREHLRLIGPDARARMAALLAAEERGEIRREELEDGGALIVETDFGRVLREAGDPEL